MYIHIGENILILEKDIIAIFNLQYIKNTKEYKSMYNDLLEKNNIVDVSNGNKKSFILTENKNGRKGYISKMAVNSILKRLD